MVLNTVVGDDAEAALIRGALSRLPIEALFEIVARLSERHINLMSDAARVSIYTSVPSEPTGSLPALTSAAIKVADHVVLDLSARSRAAIPSPQSGAERSVSSGLRAQHWKTRGELTADVVSSASARS